MGGEFEAYAKTLDSEASNMPTYKEFVDSDANAKEQFRGFAESLKGLLEYLGAENVWSYPWHELAVTVEFEPTNSKYFRLGKFGASEIHLWRASNRRNRKFKYLSGWNLKALEKEICNKNLTGLMSIGFDEDGDPDDAKPEIIVRYLNPDFNLETDVELYGHEHWRHAINEFFDLSRKINPKIIYGEVAGDIAPVKKTAIKTKQLILTG